jgi:hypothetical protein
MYLVIASLDSVVPCFTPVLLYGQDQNSTNQPKVKENNTSNSQSIHMIKELCNKVDLTLWERNISPYHIN